MIRRVSMPTELKYGFADLNQEQRDFRLNNTVGKARRTMGYGTATKSYIPGGAAEAPKDVHPQSKLAKLLGYTLIYMPPNYVMERDHIINGLNEKNKTVHEAYIVYHFQSSEFRYLYYLDGNLRSRLDQSYAPARINICIDVNTNKIVRIFYG